MPKGIEASVANGFAELAFIDPALKGPTLNRLIELVGPEMVETDTGGTHRTYIVPESAARELGLLDEPIDAPAPADDVDDPAPVDAEPELTPGQKAAATRRANKERAEREAAEQATGETITGATPVDETAQDDTGTADPAE